MPPSSTLQRNIISFTAVLLFCLLTGCFQYFYKTKEPASSNTDQYVSASKYQNRYFILRNGNDAYHMFNVVLSEDKKAITCELDTLASDHTLHLHKGRGGNMRYKVRRPEAAVLNEVHLYVSYDTTAKLHGAYTIAIDKIKRVEVVEKNKVQTAASFVVPTVATACALFLGFLLIALSNIEFE